MKKLIWISLAIFTTELLGIVGFYWLHEGYLGNTQLTISRYVGLNSWSIIVFLICNLAIIALATVYMVNSGIKKFSWRFLLGMYILCFLILSLCPHTPDDNQMTFIHRFFSAGLFVALALLGFVTTGLTNNKLARGFCYLFVLYGFHFIIAHANQLPYHMNNVLIWETIYVYGGFAVMLIAKPQKKLKS